jgi:DtxR family Mn-dependent transcriptional regulator
MAGKKKTGRTEDYLEAILLVVRKKGYARIKDISGLLDVGPSSVTEMMSKLSERGYINYEKYGAVTLTPKGEKVGMSIFSKHNTLKKFLMILDVPEDQADEEACMIEHIVSDETIGKLEKFLEFVSMEDDPRWFDHFRYYSETGKYIKCSPESKNTCPVHGKKQRENE